MITDKKLLVISSNAFSKFFNNGKTYEALFKGWEPNKLAQLYFSTIEFPDFDFCKNYFKVTEPDVLKSLFSLNTRKAGTIVENSGIDSSVPSINDENNFIKWIKKNSKNIALFRYYLWKTNLWKNSKLISWLDEFNADLIFFVPGDVSFIHDVVQWIHKKYRTPYFIYFTDDYVINKNNKGLFKYIHQKILDNRYNVTVANSSKCYAIGDMMAKDYSVKYNKHFDVLVNCIDFEILPEYTQHDFNKKDIIMSYIGGLHLNRWKSLVELGELISEINEKLSINCLINIYSVMPPSDSELQQLNKYPLSFKGSLDKEGVNKAINESDVLIHAESFDKISRLYTRYSISTKISEYLSSKKSILAFGPSEVASIRLIDDNKLGVVITDLDSKDEKMNKLIQLINNSELRETNINRAFAYATKKFNAVDIRNILKTDIEKTVENK